MGPRLEDFEILSTIGSGSHGTVRKVRRRQDGQILVWKELNYGAMSEAEKQGLVLEVNLLRELRHPYIVRFLHHVVDKRSTTLYILMEHCPGGDLKRLISKCRQTSTFLEEGFIWRILRQVCEALKVCHTRHLQKGRVILHRDIKPANVFLDANGDVKLGDFGLARTLNSEASFATTFVGTPYYMSPEVINGQEYNEMSDMWSLGCLIYELCALHPPFQATTHKQLAAKIRDGRYERIPIQYSNDLHEMIGLLLTYEDFLRPHAFIVLRHSSLIKHTSKNHNNFEDDPLCHSLRTSVLLGAENPKKAEENINKDGSTDDRKNVVESCAGRNEERGRSTERSTADGASTSKGCSSQSSVRARDRTRERSGQGASSDRYAVSPMAETFDVARVDADGDCDSRINSGIRASQEKQLVSNVSESQASASSSSQMHQIKNSYQGSQHRDQGLCDSLERICQAAKEAASRPLQGDDSTCDLMAKLECACGGMSPQTWRERVQALRESEAAVREREVSVKEREREVSHREHRVAAMEREARQHLVRAQIYLRQSRPRQNAATSPHRPPSDLDTTMSADPGEVPTATTTRLDPQRSENPFLKMRGVQPHPEKRVTFKEKSPKVKSNTLDNPRSRRKRGNIFSLAERAGSSDKTSEVTAAARQPLKVVAATEKNADSQQEIHMISPPEHERQTQTSQPAAQPTAKGFGAFSLLNKGPHGLRERPRSTENLSRKPAETTGDKENKVTSGAKPKKAPEMKQGLWNWRARSKGVTQPGRREQNTGQNRVLQFYNVV
ncbi:serine/threonine-protein kinase Nek4-like [Penaeus chinensis]|uniref:serine/threonine-protein kinase Nek4-like n=1 Tax=Penaeus chinensis TaxID=139456 RepID=UPI001FB66892|nr:serine/threonine-protein kinase Nek4-like [Penaeus chinensis]XP_047489589.1 serine/threonine-protein kinase Nek4-like [Penaeus chinensis]